MASSAVASSSTHGSGTVAEFVGSVAPPGQSGGFEGLVQSPALPLAFVLLALLALFVPLNRLIRAFIEATLTDPVRIERHWGSFGGGAGGWRMSRSLSLLFAAVLFGTMFVSLSVVGLNLSRSLVLFGSDDPVPVRIVPADSTSAIAVQEHQETSG